MEALNAVLAFGGMLVAVIGLAYLFRPRPTLIATIVLQSTGGHAQFNPPDSAAEDRIRLALSYGSKVWWLLSKEPQLARELFAEIVSECVDFWDQAGRTLLAKSPTAQEFAGKLRNTNPSATSGSVTVSFIPGTQGRLGSRSQVWNTVHGPARNALSIAWEYALLLDALYASLNQQERQHARAALKAWYELVVAPGASDGGFRAMNRLRESADVAWYTRDEFLARAL